MKLYYWNLPLRCIYIELFCDYMNINYERVAPEEVVKKKKIMPLNEKYAGFAPPFIEIDGRSYSQMPAALFYLNNKYGKSTTDTEESYFGLKCLLDVTDFMAEITRHNGSMMWDTQSWKEFESVRMKTWLSMFENQAKKRNGNFLCGNSPGIPDIAYLGCFSLLMHSFSYFNDMIRSSYPEIMHVITEFQKYDSIAKCLNKIWEQHGTLYCGGKIEKSIRSQID